jgi:exonuclease SbcD
MKILHTSDWHLGRNLENISRIDEQREFVEHVVNVANSENIDLVIIAGDIYDTYNPSVKAEELFYAGVEKLNNNGRRVVLIISGNHDNPDRLCASSPLAIKDGIILIGYPGEDMTGYKIETPEIKMVSGGRGWLELEIKSCNQNAVIITLPYPSESRLNEVLSHSCEEESLQKAYSDRIGKYLKDLSCHFRKDTVNIGVSHLFLMGGKESESERTISVGGAYTVNAWELPDNAHYIALGHLHRPQQIKNAPSPTYYSGSPLAYSFSETEYTKSMFIVEANPGEETIVRESLITCGKALRKWKAKSVEEALQWCREGRDKNAWIDIEITTDRVMTVEEQHELRRLNQGIVNIRVVIEENEKGENVLKESREGRRVEDLFKEYYCQKNKCEASEELLNALIEIIYADSEDSEDSDDTNDIFSKVGDD